MSTASTPTPAAGSATALLAEIKAEAPITRRLLERVPADQLDWRPHPKSMSIGELAVHMGRALLNLPGLLSADTRETPGPGAPTPPASYNEILESFDKGMEATTQFLSSLTPEQASATFTLVANGKTAFSMPRIAAARLLLLNHVIHHRGQLSVYLRLLEVPVPVIYGRSADENPFA